MVRRYVYDPATDSVVSLGLVNPTPDPLKVYNATRSEYRQEIRTNPNEDSGRKLLAATLERADRREFAQKKYGDERRWRE